MPLYKRDPKLVIHVHMHTPTLISRPRPPGREFIGMELGEASLAVHARRVSSLLGPSARPRMPRSPHAARSALRATRGHVHCVGADSPHPQQGLGSRVRFRRTHRRPAGKSACVRGPRLVEGVHAHMNRTRSLASSELTKSILRVDIVSRWTVESQKFTTPPA